MTQGSQNKTVGIVGLGAMGHGLSANLAKHFKTIGYDTSADACNRAAEQGVSIAESVSDVFRQCDVVLLSLPTEDVVRSVLDAVFAEGDAGKTVIFDTSTTTPNLAQEVARRAVDNGISYLDAPVTGGAWGAERAELSIMVGGDEAAFDANLDVLQAIGNKVTRIGPSGHGQVAKMVNQMLMAAIYTSVNEAFGFAVQCGADIEKIFTAVEGGGGRSMLLNKMKGPMLNGTLHDDFGLRQHGKDIRYAVKEAHMRGVELPITSSVNAFFQKSCDIGMGAIWAGEMWAVWEKLYGVNFKKTIGWEHRDGTQE